VNEHDQLLLALDAVHAARGRMGVAAGRVRVDVDQELPEWVWSTLHAHRDELVAALAGDRQIWGDGEPIWVDRAAQHELLPMPAGVDACDRCGSTDTVEQSIHDGRSVRLDCAACGRFRRFAIWNGVPMP
jgi:hypothetical protein